MECLTRPLIALALGLACFAAAPAPAQEVMGPPAPEAAGSLLDAQAARALADAVDRTADGLNPLTVLDAAGRALPGAEAGSSGLSAAMTIMVLLTVIALAPSIMLMTTCFVRVLVVLGLLKQAIGTQNLPPTQVTTALALFLTLLVMGPTWQRVWDEAVVPQQRGEVASTDELWARAKQPLRDFMFDQIEATGNWSSLYMVLNYRGIDTGNPAALSRADVDMTSLIPAFMLSELKTAFLMGFRLYLPFLVIDMVIASLLISMSMMMLPPVLISLPFKLLLFVLVDGWQLVVGSLMLSFRQGGPQSAMALPAPGDLFALGDPLLRVLGA